MSTIPTYQIPIYENADHRIRFQVEGYDLTGNTAKLQFIDASTEVLQLELSSANTKIEIEVTNTLSGFITLIINAPDSLLLSSNSVYDLFLTDAVGKRRALLRGAVCYTVSRTTF